MEKTWKVYASFPNLHSREMAAHTFRGDAEQDAHKFQRILGTQIHVRVVWEPSLYS